MAETYTEMLRRALGNTAGPAGFLLNENAALLDLFRRLRPGSARPPESPVTEPVAPAVSSNPPSSFQQAQEEAARRRAAPRPAAPAAAPAEETPETFEAMRQFQAGLREQQMQGGGGGQLSVLDMLRKRMANAMEDEQARRISDLGTALLASRSPNFLTALGEGLAAQSAGERSRMEELRRVADLERQDAAQRAEEARRQEELRIREAAQAAEAPLRAAQAQQALAMARFYSQGGSGAGRGQLTPTALAGIYQRAQAQALRDFPDPPSGMPESEAARAERLRRRAQRAEEIIAGALAAAGQTPTTAGGAPAAPTAPAAPAAIIDLGGRPTR